MTGTAATFARRLDALEEHAAHQARIIDELSEQIRAQWSVIDTLQAKQRRLIARMRELEQSSGDAPPITKPPHY